MASGVYLIRTDELESAGSVSKKLGRLIDKSGVLDCIAKDDFTAIKLHFGDVGNTGHVKPEWAREAAQRIAKKTPNAFLSDSNVIYKMGRRAHAVEHLRIAEEHGFTLKNTGVPILIADGLRGTNFTEVAVSGKHFSKVKIASDFACCDSMLAMSHMTGHIVTGMGCAIKNIGMGCAARRGKYEQHCGAAPEVNPDHCVGCGACVAACPAGCLKLKDRKITIDKSACQGCGECAVICKTKAIEIRWSETLEKLQEKMVEYASGAIKALNGKIGYINFLIKVTKDCDCLAKDDPRIVKDIGILASSDPVAIDKASVDLILDAAGKDVFKEGYPETNWSVHLDHAAALGLGSMKYDLKAL
jgi:uncharacterized Fe-S center protein